jgi:hypothetical protein
MDTLYVLFKGDNSDLKTKASESKKVVEDLGRSFMDMATSFTSVITSALTTGALVAGIKSASAYAQQLDLASRQLNVNVEDLSAWGDAVRRTGGSVEGFESSLKGLATHLGVTNATALKLLPQLADGFQKIGRIRSQNYGQMLGLDESTILLLQQGSRAVDDLLKRQKELGVVTKLDAETSRKFSFAIQDTEHAFRSMFLAVADSVLPVLTKLSEVLIPTALYFRQHSDFIVGALYAIAAAAGVAAIAMGALTSPFVIAAAAVGLFALAYDDLETFFKGGDSLIGRAAQRWPLLFEIIAKSFRSIRDSAKYLKDALGLGNGADNLKLLGLGDDNGALQTSLKDAKGKINEASSSVFNSQSSNSIFNSAQRSTTGGDITISEINIQTQATDADGIAGALQKGIREHLWNANSNFDDGIAI